jgi:hypothetical protein
MTMNVLYSLSSLLLILFVGGFGAIAGGVVAFFVYKAWQNYLDAVALRAHKAVFQQYSHNLERFISTTIDHLSFSPQFMSSSPDPAEQKSTIREMQSSVIPSTRYDIVFDSDLTTFVAGGSFAYGWKRVMQEIISSIDEKESSFPEGTNTILVRSVHMSEEGKNEYILETLKNENLKKLSGE